MPVKARRKMPSQCSAFRLTVAEQMAGYEQRIARKIKKEAEKRGENATDMASGLGVNVSTTERWLRAERVPQVRHQKELRQYWDLAPDFFEVDLESEEKELRDQLNRVEAKLDRLLLAAGVPTDFDSIVAELEQTIVEVDQPDEPNASSNGEQRPASENR